MKVDKIETVTESVISADEIQLIIDRYRIGKKPLAKLLGWGETTIIRYMEGDIPTSEYSNKLKTILEEPEYYYNLLLKRKECLTGIAFKKSRMAVLSKIMASKIYTVSYYIVNRCEADICASQLQYLLYYAQAFSLALFDRELFQEECGINGEQIPYIKLYESLKRSGIATLEGVEEYLTLQEIELLDTIMESFQWYGPKALQAITAYEKSAIKISRDRFNNKIISKEAMKAYFKEILNYYHITDVRDIHKYPDQKINAIREFIG